MVTSMDCGQNHGLEVWHVLSHTSSFIILQGSMQAYFLQCAGKFLLYGVGVVVTVGVFVAVKVAVGVAVVVAVAVNVAVTT